MLCIPLLLVLTSGAVDQPAYHRGTFRAVEATLRTDHRDLLETKPGEPKDQALIHPIEKVRVRVTNTGRVRPLKGFKQTVTLGWCRQNFPGAEALLANEIEVVEDGVARWLPIQEQLIAFLRREVPSGGAMDVFVVWFGAANAEHVYIVNDFLALEAPPAFPKP